MKQEKGCKGICKLISEMNNNNLIRGNLKSSKFNHIRNRHTGSKHSKAAKQEKRFVFISFINLKNSQQEYYTIDTKEETIIKNGITASHINLISCFSSMQAARHPL